MSRKLTYEFVKKQFEKEGYTLLSKEYKNNHTKLDYVCPKRHKHSIKFIEFQTGRRCPYCAGLVKHTIEFVKKQFEKEGYTLLSKEYKNSTKKLDYVCPVGHKHSIRWGDFQQGHRCPTCPTCSKGRVSKKSQKWLNSLNVKHREVRIKLPEFIKEYYNHKHVFVDGYNPETLTVYEFDGDFWHGNPAKYDSDKVNQISKKTFGELYNETLNKKRALKELGFNVVSIWESTL